ncbi:pyridoxal-phosphate dependent enzyme [Chitinophaga sp. GbtcB8]|uniref:pyridoxal-phosphate dependent enzyme n=1 Tax=Chitinophaga sp. GbtcB8 TaxID=2824753 RepID=UPI001C2F84DD|nr:pyridoxal-phosphate dependent enzyme [Chitinophaga sp. GbtcB8]
MHDLLTKLEGFRSLIGNTRIKKLDVEHIDVYAKLEYENLFGSIKDRAAFYIIAEAIRNGQLTAGNFVVESSSGNFAIALMGICNALDIGFMPVIDPNINEDYEKILRLGCDVVKVTETDETGGYLLTRIKKVKEIVREHKNAFWTNQYANVNNYLSYYHSIGAELGASFEKLDYVFAAVSSGGTITGLSLRLREFFPGIKVVAVDIEGSLVFSDTPQKRYISGIGASKRSDFLQHAKIDDVVHVSHRNIIRGCRELLKEQSIFAGGSSGACYHAVKTYFSGHRFSGIKPVAAFICPDKGNAYLNNIFNDAWAEKITALAEREISIGKTY